MNRLCCFGLPLLLILCSVANPSSAQSLLLRCPIGGVFTGAQLIGDQPNPAAGWMLSVFGSPASVSVMKAPGMKNHTMITCALKRVAKSQQDIGLVIEARSCRIVPNGGTFIGGDIQQCIFGEGTPAEMNDRCLITCDP